MNESRMAVLSWDEPVINHFTQQNAINIADVEFELSGHLTGLMKSIYVIHYTKYNIEKIHEAQSTFTGYSIFTGEIGNKKGTIVFTENGVHENGLFSTLEIKQATDELSNINGQAKYSLLAGKVILETEF